jgi:hypothetical protein
MYKVYFVNGRPGYIEMSKEQFILFYWGDYLGAGLDVDTYMSLKCKYYPVD